MTRKTIQVAPMVGVTTQHFNHFIRLICSNVGLYTEMISTSSIRHGRVLQRMHNIAEKQIIQLAGNVPSELSFCASKSEQLGFAGVNLNIGCPSCKIKKANYGAVLFKYPSLVAECVRAMKDSCAFPVSVKTRIGVDDIDNYQYLYKFIALLLDNGCDEIVLHARKAYLKGLSPKANRTVPPLDYATVAKLNRDFPNANFCLNGGITTIKQVEKLFERFDNLMLGRIIEKNPLILVEIYNLIEGTKISVSRYHIYNEYLKYIEINKGCYNKIMLLKPLFGLYHGTRISKQWHTAVVESFRTGSTDVLTKLSFAEGL